MKNQVKLKQLQYENYRVWLKKIYLSTILELYKQRDYTAIKRVIYNYETIINIIKSEDPIYRNKPSIQIKAKRGLLGKQGRFIFKEKPEESKGRQTSLIRKPLSEENIQKQIADIARAERWFSTITPIPEDNQPT